MDSRIVDHYVQTHNRLFLLDYDGTLVRFQRKPEWAVPTPKLLSVLERLGSDPANQIVIVSGRDRTFLDRQFGALPLGFAAEHGYFIKDRNGRWHRSFVQKNNWKPLVRHLMEAAASQHHGVHIEEKASSLVWHYDGAGPGAAMAATQLRRQLRPHLPGLGLIAERGHKILEVRVAGVNKGQVVRHWLERSDWDFVLAAGDDTTDEDLFRALPPSGISIKIGPGATSARYRLGGPAAMVALLSSLQ
jgi:trehalose 6-phosphate synthase/phosphatase